MKSILTLTVLVAMTLTGMSVAVAEPEPVVTIRDSRITESSGLALSPKHPRLVYTLNDSGNAAEVYAINRRDGDVVGVTTLRGYELADTEAIGVGSDGTMWIADIGDNNRNRDDIALYALPEPGRRNATVRPRQYPLRFPGRPRDAETILVGPESKRLLIVSKGLLGGAIYRVPRERREDRPNRLRRIQDAPGLITDGSFTPDGSRIVLRTYREAYAYSTGDWEETWTAPLPKQRQGESLTVTANGQGILVGSEGSPSAIHRLRLPAPQAAKPESKPETERRAGRDAASDRAQIEIGIRVLIGLAVLIAVLIGWALISAYRNRKVQSRSTT